MYAQTSISIKQLQVAKQNAYKKRQDASTRMRLAMKSHLNKKYHKKDK